METPCSLRKDIKIRIEPLKPVWLYMPGEYHEKVALRPGDGLVEGILDENGWMFIQHTHAGAIDLVGLPLCGELKSWEYAFEYESIELYIRTPPGTSWKKLKRWEDLPFVPAHT